MKKLFTQSICLALIAAGLLLSTLSHAQVPQKFNYQGIARDVKGNPIGKQTLALKLSVLPTEDASVAEYEETQTVTTNEFGLYTLQIGNGSPLIGDMKTVKWETGNKYIRVAIDPKGGSDYTVIGTSQLLSVPYAIYADKAGLARETVGQDGKTRTGAVSSNAAHVVGDANYVTKFTALNTIGKSLIFDNGSRVGIGTNAPLASGLLHLKSAIGTQPLILESPQGVHNLIQENGINRGYFGSYIGSGGAYPTPAGTSDADFDIGTSGASTGKLHFATNTTPRVTILPTTGFVGVGTTSPSTMFQVNKATDPIFKLSNTASGATTTDGLDITLSGSNASINNRESGSLSLSTTNTERLIISSIGNVGIGTSSPAVKLDVNSTGNNHVAKFNGPAPLYMSIFEGGNYLGYWGSYSGNPEDVDFGTGSGNITGKLHLTSEAIPVVTVAPGGFTGFNKTSPAVPIDATSDGLMTTASSFTTTAVQRLFDTVTKTSEKTGLYVNIDGSQNQNSGIFADVTSTGNINSYGLFARVSATPGISGRNYGLLAFDPIDASNTFAARIYGKLQYTHGNTSAGSVLVSEGNGGVAKWDQQVAFKAYGMSNAGTVNSSGSLDPIFNTIQYNNGSAYNNTTGEFTAPSTGIYHFNFAVETYNGTNTSGYYQVGLLKNGIAEPGSYFELAPNNIGYQTNSGTTEVFLDAGDIIKVTFHNGTSVNTTVTNSTYWTAFSGYKVR